MNLKEGDIVIIEGRECPVKHGPWKYENKKHTKHGYGLYVDLMLEFAEGNSSELVWKYRCGVDELDNFGIKIEAVKSIYYSLC